MSQHNGLPLQLFTANPDDVDGQARTKIEIGRASFGEGREFRVSHEMSITTSSQVVFKVVSPIDFILRAQSLDSDVEGIKFQAFRDIQGTEGGTFSTPIPVYKNNGQSSAQAYTGQVSIDTGGTFTPTGGQVAVETLRVRVSGATAQQTTVSAAIQGERGLPAGTYYLVFTNITGSGTAEGVYALIFEERPAYLNDWLEE